MRADGVDEDAHLDPVTRARGKRLADSARDLATSPHVRLEMDRVSSLADVPEQNRKEAVSILEDLDDVALADGAARNPRDRRQRGGEVVDRAQHDGRVSPARAEHQEPAPGDGRAYAREEPEPDVERREHRAR